MDQVLQVLIGGLVLGGIYGGMALALVLVYQATGLINFAQGELAVLSTYLCLTLLNLGFPYPAAFLLTLAGAYGLGVAVERTVIRRFYGASHMVEVVVVIGLLIAVGSLTGAIWGHDVKTFPSPFGDGSLDILGVFVRHHDLGALATTGLIMGLVFGFLKFTKTGLAMRAAALNPASARLSAIPVSRLLGSGWGLANVVGAVSGMMIAPIVFLDPSMMGGVLTLAFAAAILGGVNNTWGAVVGGLLVGIAESALVNLLPSVGQQLKLTLALSLIVVALLLFPHGLFGRKTVVRA